MIQKRCLIARSFFLLKLFRHHLQFQTYEIFPVYFISLQSKSYNIIYIIIITQNRFINKSKSIQLLFITVSCVYLHPFMLLSGFYLDFLIAVTINRITLRVHKNVPCTQIANCFEMVARGWKEIGMGEIECAIYEYMATTDTIKQDKIGSNHPPGDGGKTHAWNALDGPNTRRFFCISGEDLPNDFHSTVHRQVIACRKCVPFIEHILAKNVTYGNAKVACLHTRKIHERESTLWYPLNGNSDIYITKVSVCFISICVWSSICTNIHKSLWFNI